MNDSSFIRAPKLVIDGIPVFSEGDAYVGNYDKIARDHLNHLEASGKSPFMTDHQIKQSEEVTINIVRRHLPAGSRVLDAGVGTGSLLNNMPEYDRYGVDIAIDYLRIARQGGIKAALAKLAELPYLDNYFDGVVVCDVLEHLIDMDASVAQLVRVLKPGGILVVRVPNEESLSLYLTDNSYMYAHVRAFSRDSLRLYLEKCFSFRYVTCDYAARSFYISSQLLNPAPALNSDLRAVVRRLDNAPWNQRKHYAAALQSIANGLVANLEEQINALIFLRDHQPEIFAELASATLRPAELIGVFSAP